MRTKSFAVYRGYHGDNGGETIILVDETGVAYELSPFDGQPLENFFDADQLTIRQESGRLIRELPKPETSFEITGDFR
jgi:hypothetical protein